MNGRSSYCEQGVLRATRRPRVGPTAWYWRLHQSRTHSGIARAELEGVGRFVAAVLSISSTVVIFWLPEVIRNFLVLILLSIGMIFGQAPYYSSIRPLDTANDIPANRGSAAVWQLLQKLHTRASLIMFTAHPDDEDGGMLTYESRGRGTRVSLLTLNRGEGGANVMSPDYFDALGLVRTMELLEAGRHYGVDQYWTRVTDYGFSKTKEEALGQWTRDRVLADCVRVVRMTRPLVVTSVFAGGASDGHGNHQVAGQMAKEVFAAAADPNMFPEQIRAGLQPWAPLKYYARAPMGRRSGGPTLAVKLEIPAGSWDPLLGSSYAQLAREGLGLQKSQNGGPSVPQAGPQNSAYHRFASRVPAEEKEQSFFDGIDTSLQGIASLAGSEDASFLKESLKALNFEVDSAIAGFNAREPAASVPSLSRGLELTESCIEAVNKSALSAGAKYGINHELNVKRAQFNHALTAALGLSVNGNVTMDAGAGGDNPAMAAFRGQPDTFRVAIPGQRFAVRVHLAAGPAPVKLNRLWLETPEGEPWQVSTTTPPPAELARTADVTFEVVVPPNAAGTKPYFARPHLGFPYYDKIDERYLNQPLAPYPLTAWAEFQVGPTVIRTGQIVQTTQRVTGLGTVSEPLVTGPPISVSMQPRAGIVPLGAISFSLTVALRSNVKGSARGKVRLECPAGWKSEPGSIAFSMPSDGAEQFVHFDVTPAKLSGNQKYECSAIAEYDGRQYREGYQVTGYPGLRPYFLYRTAAHSTSGVDVKVAPNLKVAYITGTGDETPEALANLGIKPAFLSSADLAGGDLSKFDVILLGVRAYAAREDLKANNARLLEYVKNGGVAIVQYNTPEFDHNYGPYPYTMNNPEEVTDEASKMEILDPANPIFTYPNKITLADFDNWIEERGSKFMRTWDSNYKPLLSTQDAGQEPQKGGLLFARYGKGIYVYNAYAFYRQLPEGVPGAYRLLANMLSLPRSAR